MSDAIVKIPHDAYAPAGGALGTVHANNIVWETCRDRFQLTSDPVAYMQFVFHAPGRVDDVIEFIRTIEQIIRLPAESQLTLSKTSQKNVLHVTLTPWWKYRLRRSLLTALLRCGQAYTEHSGAGFERALWSQGYTNSTKEAVLRFLGGYTSSKLKKRAGFYGWQQLFSFNTKAQAEHVLVKLKKKRKEEAAPEAVPEVPAEVK